MSIKTIKQVLEAKLNGAITTTAIKWNDTTAYTLNSVPLSPTQISDLTIFIAPKIIPISQDRELIGSATPRKFEVFFQVSIYSKVKDGTGNDYDLVETLDNALIETVTSGVTVDGSRVLPSFEIDGYTITPVRFLCWVWG